MQVLRGCLSFFRQKKFSWASKRIDQSRTKKLKDSVESPLPNLIPLIFKYPDEALQNAWVAEKFMYHEDQAEGGAIALE